MRAERRLDAGHADARVARDLRGRRVTRRARSSERRARLQRILRRDQPPHLIEPERPQAHQADLPVALMGGIEGAAEYADAHPGEMLRQRDDVAAGELRHRRETTQGRTCPLPRRRYLKLVSCSTPTGPAGMHAAGRDADLGAHAELAAIGELRRGIVEHDGAVDLATGSAPRRPCRR